MVVNGLEMFSAWFADYKDQYVLIGGTAAAIALNEEGLQFRTTKDLDIVLHLEALTPAFAQTFWEFVKRGGYKIQQESETGQAKFFRFQDPADEEFPYMLELFARTPQLAGFAAGGRLTQIPFDAEVSSLSAIILHDEYYQFVIGGRQVKDGFPSWIGVDRLIPLKAHAWLDLTDKKRRGESGHSNKIRKHLSDINRLSVLLAPETVVQLPGVVAADMQQFIAGVRSSGAEHYEELLARLERSFVVGSDE